MIITPDRLQREYLKNMGVRGRVFNLYPSDVKAAADHAREQHPKDSEEQIQARAIARVAYAEQKASEKPVPAKAEPWAWWQYALILLALIVLFAFAAHSQTSPSEKVCVATAAAPTYGEGKINFLSCDLAGTLRTTASGGGGGGGAVTQSGTWNVGLLAGTAVIGHVLVDSAPTTAVTGTFWQATQPVSGTFWQATQPVSGTFWQATQPVSGTVAATQSGTWNVNATLAAESTKVIGTVNIAASQTVGLVAGSAVIGHVIVDTAPTTAVTNAGLTNLDVALSTRTKPADQQHAILDSGTTTVTQATGSNLHVQVDTAPSTAVTNAGLTNLDVALSTRTKPADQQHAILDSGTTTVTQGTGTNLHVVVDTAPSTAVTGTVTSNQGTTPWVEAGNVASGASDSGNPVKVGGVYNSFYNPNYKGPLSLQNGQRADLQVDSFGRLLVVNPETPQLLAALSVSPRFFPRIAGSFNRPITSTGDALDVNIKYPEATFDPCLGPTKTSIPISVTGNTKLINGQSGKLIRICSIFLLSSSAESFSVVEGTGSTCATSIAGVIGSTTAANGPSIAANLGYAQGTGGAFVASGNSYGADVCILISGSTLIAGNLTYAF